MTDIVHSLSGIKRKLKFGIFIPRKITLKPKNSKAVISDLFPIRNDVDWKTEFELLNVPGLIKGDNNTNTDYSVTLYFFDDNGNLLGNKNFFMNGVGRQTIKLSEFLKNEISKAKTFAVFHNNKNISLDMDGSFLAERGYTGYEYKNNGVKGYIHGNLDAVSLGGYKIKPIGNLGIIKRFYLTQHKLIGPSKYEFVFTNPTRKKIIIKPFFNINNWEKLPNIVIHPLGSKTMSVTLNPNAMATLKFKSRLYLCRPVVFRIQEQSMDVFHG
jgi:hypothetical protein